MSGRPCRTTLQRSVASGAVLFQTIDEEDTAGLRPAPLSEVAGPQERVLRRITEQNDEFVPVVQIIDAPVPQVVDNPNIIDEVVQRTVEQVPREVELVIAVPKISTEDPAPCRAHVPQMVEQFVEVPRTSFLDWVVVEQSAEVPSTVSQSSLLRIVEQIVDIPVPAHGRSSSSGISLDAPNEPGDWVFALGQTIRSVQNTGNTSEQMHAQWSPWPGEAYGCANTPHQSSPSSTVEAGGGHPLLGGRGCVVQCDQPGTWRALLETGQRHYPVDTAMTVYSANMPCSERMDQACLVITWV